MNQLPTTTQESVNQTVFRKAFYEANEKATTKLSFYGDDNCYFLLEYNKVILEIHQDFVDESGMNPINFFISMLYESERGQSKNKATVIKSKLTKLYKKILNEDTDEMVLELVRNAKELQSELEALTSDIEWIKSVAYFLYQIKDSIEHLEYDYFIELIEVA